MNQEALLKKLGGSLDSIMESVSETTEKIGSLEKRMYEVEKKANRLPFSLSGPNASRETVRGPRDADSDLMRGAGLWLSGLIRSKANGERHPHLAEAARIFGVSVEDLVVQRVAAQEDIGNEGGYTVPTQMLNEIVRLRGYLGLTRLLARRVTMRSMQMMVPTLANPLVAGWTNEEGTIGDAVPATPFGQGTLTAKKLAGIATVSMELLQDSVVDLGSWFVEVMAETLAKAEDAAALEGTGSPFTGLYSASGVNAVSVGAALTNVDKLADGLYALPVSALESPGTAWVMAPKAWKAIQKLKIPQYSGDTGGAYMVNPTPTEDTPRSLFGRPVYLCDQIATNRGGGTNETTLYVGDFLQGLLLGERMQMTLDVNPYSKFGTGQVDLRIMERVGVLVCIPSAFSKMTGVQVS